MSARFHPLLARFIHIRLVHSGQALIHNGLDFINTSLDLIRTWVDLIQLDLIPPRLDLMHCRLDLASDCRYDPIAHRYHPHYRLESHPQWTISTCLIFV
jgi:hypothetical protein